MIKDAPNLNALWASLIVEELTRNGVHTFVISSGSRSAPLALAATNHRDTKTHVHFDERGAAFFALGHAKATQRPVALICTSGTAVANYMPAIVEAAMAFVPLIALTADRPPELLDTGANQTIDQANLFGTHVRWHHTLPCPDAKVPPETALTVIDQAVYRATQSPRGPVHINCMFREPLAQVKEAFEREAYLASVETWLSQEAPYTRYSENDSRSLVLDDELGARLADAKRPLLIVGQLYTQTEVDAAEAIARRLGWPTLPDIASGLRLGSTVPNAIHHYNQLLKTPIADELVTANTILHIGGSIVSKNLLSLLARRTGGTYTRVADHPFREDPAHRVTHRIASSVKAFATALEDSSATHSNDENWFADLRAASEAMHACLESFDTGDGISELGVARIACNAAPEGGVLFLGNSMPIRDADSFALHPGRNALVVANRGASGIDGNIATVAGYAHALGKPVLAVIGDLAALHDLNSLALLDACPAPVVLLIVNNDGGGIFSMLPIGDFPDHFERCFGTPHGLTFESAAAQFNLDYAQPGTAPECASAIEKAFQAKGAMIVEVLTDREENAALHRQLDVHVAAAFKQS